MQNTTARVLSWDDAPDILKPQEAAKIMRIGKNKIYELISRSEGFPKLCLGERQFIIPKEALRRWIDDESTRK